jgi:hypothetical protein
VAAAPYAEKKSRRVVCLMEDCAQTSGRSHCNKRKAPAWKASGAFSFLNVDIENIYIQEKKSHAGNPRVCLCRGGSPKGYLIEEKAPRPRLSKGGFGA